MGKSRRLFLKVVGVGAAGTTVHLGCMGFVEDGALVARDGVGGADTGHTGTGGAGTGGTGTTGVGGFRGSGQGGAGGVGTGGQPGSAIDGGARDVGADLQRDTGVGARDSGPAPRDAGPVLQPGDIAAGNVSNLAVGALNQIPNQSVAIGRDAMGVYALTLICTHQGCTAAPASNGATRQINCPCHGSQFDRDGAVIRGPAARPLVHFAVVIDGAGNIIVRTNSQVTATVRVAP